MLAAAGWGARAAPDLGGGRWLHEDDDTSSSAPPPMLRADRSLVGGGRFEEQSSCLAAYVSSTTGRPKSYPNVILRSSVKLFKRLVHFKEV